MNRGSFDKLSLGFLFVLIDFRIQGFDILPDIIGYVLFAIGFSRLTAYSDYFRKASYANIPMLIISLFSIYEKPAQDSGITFGPLGLMGIPLSIATFILSLLVVYYLFMGIIEMAQSKGLGEIVQEADTRWKQYLYLQLAGLLIFIFIFVPLLGIAFIIGLLIISVVLTFAIMKFMKICGEHL
ncbi:MAG: hypothetical protein K0R50_111 [Eubacterium sp.]|jgi:hypothetical protein|nr:hypothetical protein [Eubacterium sp.]